MPVLIVHCTYCVTCYMNYLIQSLLYVNLLLVCRHLPGRRRSLSGITSAQESSGSAPEHSSLSGRNCQELRWVCKRIHVVMYISWLFLKSSVYAREAGTIKLEFVSKVSFFS